MTTEDGKPVAGARVEFVPRGSLYSGVASAATAGSTEAAIAAAKRIATARIEGLRRAQ